MDPGPTLAEVHAFLSTPDVRSRNDGYAVASDIARGCRRSISGVRTALHYGEKYGLFEKRPHPAPVHGESETVYEYRAISTT